MDDVGDEDGVSWGGGSVLFDLLCMSGLVHRLKDIQHQNNYRDNAGWSTSMCGWYGVTTSFMTPSTPCLGQKPAGFSSSCL